MPELPEVETMRRLIVRELIGRTVERIDLRLSKLIRTSPLPSLDMLIGRRLLGARRRAKVLIVDFDDDLSWLAHFKLSGQLAIEHAGGERFVAGHPVPDPAGVFPHKATHLIVHFSEGTTLFHSDIRQFGWLRLMPTADVEAAIAAFAFGPEAVGDEAVTLPDLTTRLARRRIPVKQALLDQGVIAGLGNIYVDEALHHAGVHPLRRANALEAAALARLHASIQWSLNQGIAQGGAKIIHNRAYPRDGFPQVYGREGKACPTCATAIMKTRVDGRGTYLCPVCQPEAAPPRRAPSRAPRSKRGVPAPG